MANDGGGGAWQRAGQPAQASCKLQQASQICQNGSNHLGRRSCGANSFGLWELRVLGQSSALPQALKCQQSRAMVRVRGDTMGTCSQSLQLCSFFMELSRGTVFHGTILHAGADCYRVVPLMKAKEAAKLMAWGLGPDWQGTNASALISNVVCGIRRGMAIAPTGYQAKVADYQMVFMTIAHVLMLRCHFSPAWEHICLQNHASRVLMTSSLQWAMDKIYTKYTQNATNLSSSGILTFGLDQVLQLPLRTMPCTGILS